MSLLILVVDDESDVEMLFRQQFRRDLRAGRFAMEFAQSAEPVKIVFSGPKRVLQHYQRDADIRRNTEVC
jgi:CheY-like chemotaxis protein